MKKLLMIVYNDLSQDARVQRSYESLNELYDVTIISYGKDNQGSKTIYQNHVVITLNRDDNQYKSFFLFIKKVLENVKKKKFDILYCHDYYTALLLLILKRRNIAKKYIYDAHELYIPEKNQRFSIRSRFFYFFEKLAIKKVDLLICAQEKRGKIMKEHFKLNKTPLVIRNVSKLPKEDNSKGSDILDKYQDFFKIKGTCIVYAGVIIKTRNIDGLVKAVDQLGNDYKLIIIGEGNYSESLNEYIKNLSNRNIISIGSVPYLCLATILGECDIGYLFYPTEGLNNIYCAPNKIHEYASVELPIIANENPTVKGVIDSYNIGVSCNNISYAITEISNNYEFYKNNIKRFNEEESWERERERLQVAIKNLFVKE